MRYEQTKAQRTQRRNLEKIRKNQKETREAIEAILSDRYKTYAGIFDFKITTSQICDELTQTIDEIILLYKAILKDRENVENVMAEMAAERKRERIAKREANQRKAAASPEDPNEKKEI